MIDFDTALTFGFRIFLKFFFCPWPYWSISNAPPLHEPFFILKLSFFTPSAQFPLCFCPFLSVACRAFLHFPEQTLLHCLPLSLHSFCRLPPPLQNLSLFIVAVQVVSCFFASLATAPMSLFPVVGFDSPLDDSHVLPFPPLTELMLKLPIRLRIDLVTPLLTPPRCTFFFPPFPSPRFR